VRTRRSSHLHLKGSVWNYALTYKHLRYVSIDLGDGTTITSGTFGVMYIKLFVFISLSIDPLQDRMDIEIVKYLKSIQDHKVVIE
jgi:hypothetical protein